MNRYVANIRIIPSIALMLCLVGIGFSQDSTLTLDSVSENSDPSSVTLKDSNLTTDSLETKQINLLENVDILGENSISSMYIFWDSFSADMYTEVKKSIDKKKFATDHYFMQNIDREEFEQERILLLFEDRKKNFHNLFGDNLEDLISAEEE